MKKILIFIILITFVFSFTNCDLSNNDTIGSKGQGGGVIFFAEGGQYKECSGELGDNTWLAAVTAARNYKGGGFEDWRLPDRAELDLMYKNLKVNKKGGFAGSLYWTSVQDDTYNAWAQDFRNGYQTSRSKTNNYGVRAVRSYSDIPVVETETTTLTIKNESFIEITEVIWNSVPFTTGQTTIKTGTNVVKSVSASSGYIFFKKAGNPIPARTTAILTVNEDEKLEFVFTNNTIITEVSNPVNSATLQTFYTKPWIIVKQGTTAVNLYSNFIYGSILKDTPIDKTFTIENIGEENLIITSVNEKRINLDENTEGYFSVIQQPLASTIPPGSTINFTIRFNPEEIGNNYSASVHIKTNSYNAEEFVFRVIGSGRNYIIGDEGPGGGTIFFTDGGQFMECSGDLGNNTWDNAVTIAGNYKGGGFDDWILPSLTQLFSMYENLHKRNMGGFSNVAYWANEEYEYYGNLIYAYYVDFGTSYQQRASSKTNTYRIRAVRSFNDD